MNYLVFFLTIFIFFYASNANEVKQRNFPNFKGIISAFGDFNSDKFTDIFFIKNNSYCLQIVRQISGKTENDQQIFIEEKSLSYCLSPEDQIVNLIPSDFDGDAVMDLAVVIKKDKYYEVIIIKGDKDKFGKVLLEKTGKLLNQPLLLDINGDMISDLLVLAENEKNEPKYYIYKGGKSVTKELFIDRADIKFADPNSNAFIDLNRDGVSDIFLEEQNQMFYYFAGTNGYKEYKEIKYPKNKIIGSSSFCDINSEERIDHIIPVCENEGKPPCSIIIYDSEKNDWVTLVDEIKVGEDEFYFEKPTVTFENGNKIKIPIRLRHGYVNENGYTDLMALMKRKSDKKDDWHIVLFNNRRNKIKNKEQKFYFEISALNETMDGNPILVTFFDLYEDGVIDILVNFENFKISSANYEFKTLTLNNFADVNFIKVLVTSGLCNNEKCFEKKVYGENTYLAYGTNNPGPMICYQLVNSYNNVMKSCGGQLSQSSDFALQMPYTIFGLGLYANYIEKLKAVIPSGNTSLILQKKVEQIVPDSQIVIIPNPLNDPNLWKVKLFLTPSDIIYKTLYTLTGICVILIVIIGVLHRKEMLEDVKEQAEFKKQWPEIRR